MYTVKIPYTDYNGEERNETFHFNLNKKELSDLNFEVDGGLEYYINKITETRNPKHLVDLVTSVIDKSYGVKSADGLNFRKSEEILAEFKSREAYSELYTMLLSDADKLADFINGITSAARASLEKNSSAPPQIANK